MKLRQNVILNVKDVHTLLTDYGEMDNIDNYTKDMKKLSQL